MSEEEKATRWPWVILSILVLFVMGMASLIVMAVSSPFELVADDYYAQELAYQTQIEKEERALNLSDKPEVVYRPGSKAVDIVFPASLEKAELGRVAAYRPSARDLDREFELALDDTGRSSIPVTELASGFWKLGLSWRLDGKEYYQKAALVIP